MLRNNIKVVDGHLLQHTTESTSYEPKMNRFGWFIRDDKKQRILVSKTAARKYFI